MFRMIFENIVIIVTILIITSPVDCIAIFDSNCLHKPNERFELSATTGPTSMDFFHKKNTKATLKISITYINIENHSDQEDFDLDMDVYGENQVSNPKSFHFHPPFDERNTGWHRLHISIGSNGYNGVTVSFKDKEKRIWFREYFKNIYVNTFKITLYGGFLLINCSLNDRFFEIPSNGGHVTIPLPFDSEDIPDSVIWFSTKNSTKAESDRESKKRNGKIEIVNAAIVVSIETKYNNVSILKKKQNIQLNSINITALMNSYGEKEKFSLSTAYKFSSWTNLQMESLPKDVEEESQQYYISEVTFWTFIGGREPHPKLYLKTVAVWSGDHPPIEPSIGTRGRDAAASGYDFKEMTIIIAAVAVVIVVVILCFILTRRFIKKPALSLPPPPPIPQSPFRHLAVYDEKSEDEEHIYDDWDQMDFQDNEQIEDEVNSNGAESLAEDNDVIELVNDHYVSFDVCQDIII